MLGEGGWGGVRAHQQVLHQGLHILGGIWGGRVVRRQLDQRREEVLAFLHVLLHLLSEGRGESRSTRRSPSFAFTFTSLQRGIELKRTWDTTVTLLAGTAGVAAGVLVSGADGTPAGLAKGAPTAVITVGAF